MREKHIVLNRRFCWLQFGIASFFAWSLVLQGPIAQCRQPTPDTKAKDYADLLHQVQSKRRSILAVATNLIQVDRNLKQRILEADRNATLKYQLAKDIPEVGLSTSLSFQATANKSNSSRVRSSSSRTRGSVILKPGDVVTETTTIIDNSPQKRAIAREAQLWKLQSVLNQRSMAINHHQFTQIMGQLVGNLNEFVSLVDVYGNRSQQESEIAEEISDAWLADDPTHVGAMLIRCAALRNLGRVEMAENFALEARRHNSPANPCAMTLHAQCLFLRGKAKESSIELDQVIRLTKGTATEEPYALKAMLEATNGNMNLALDHVKDACRLAPNCARVLSLRALIECNIDDKELMLRNGLAHAGQAVKMPDSDWFSHFAILFAESKAGNDAAAQTAGSHALKHANGRQKEFVSHFINNRKNMRLQEFDFESLWTAMFENAR